MYSSLCLRNGKIRSPLNPKSVKSRSVKSRVDCTELSVIGFAAPLKSQHAIKNQDSRQAYVQKHFSTVQVQLVVRDKVMGKLVACKVLL